MKILIIRHGDPDYEHDSLTEKGFKEADYLAEMLKDETVRAFYVSPKGRAKATAKPTLEKLNATATELQWLREFEAPIVKPNIDVQYGVTWDWLPADWTKEEKYFDKEQWCETDIMKDGHVKEENQWVCEGLDALLLKYGYRRNGYIYDAIEPNNDTIVFFCHFGLECVLLGHLLNISPMVLWHGTAAAPSSVTTVVTEERRPGIASFRMLSFGSTAHLKMKGEPPAFSARFRECYTNEDERLD